MKNFFSLSLLVILFYQSIGQQNKFSKVYYANGIPFSARGMVKSYNDGLIICGINNSASAILSIDSTGSILWAKQLGSGPNESFNSIVRTHDSCYVIAGTIFDINSSRFKSNILKIDRFGNLVWSMELLQNENQVPVAIDVCLDRGFILAGYETSISAPYNRILVTKLDSTGNVQWSKSMIGGNSTNFASSVKQTADSGFVVIGYTENFPPIDGRGFLCKISSSGNMQWAKTYNSTNSTKLWGNDISIAPDGIYSLFNSATEYEIVKTDFNGNDIWLKTISGIPTSIGCETCVSSKLKLLSNGNLIFANGIGADGYGMQTVVVNIDSTGSFNWSKYLQNSVHYIEEAADHGLFYLGNGPLMGIRANLYPHIGVIKTDSLGDGALCTDPNPNIILSSGNVFQSTLFLISTLPSISATLVSPTIINLNLLENNGCVDIVGEINDDASDGIIILYPNPSISSLDVLVSGLNENDSFYIVDILGNVVYRKDIDRSANANFKIDHILAKGFYTVVVNSKRGEITKKLIIQ